MSQPKFEPIARSELRERGWKDARAFWVLSTGRCGTRTLAHLLDLADGATVEHEPLPRLNRQCREVYEQWATRPEPYRLLIEACREDVVYKAYEDGQAYGETANRLTYFAPAIREVFTNSKFLHLVRDPRHVVRSGMDRGWYDTNKWDEGRIVPRTGDPYHDRWDEMSLFERCAWFWYETNRFAREFTDSLEPGRAMTVRAEDLFAGNPETVAAVFDFLELEAPKPKRVAKVLGTKANYQRRRTFPDVAEWSDDQNEALRGVAGPMMDALGY